MKAILILLPLLLFSITICKDTLLEQLYDTIMKNKTVMPSDSDKYVKDFNVSFQLMDKTVDKSLIPKMKEEGLLQIIDESIYAECISTRTTFDIIFDKTYNKTSVNAIEMGNKVRFAYYEAKVESKIIKQKEKIIETKCKKGKCYSVITFKDKNTLSKEEVKKIVSCNQAKAEEIVLKEIKKSIARTDLKFLA